ncbi:MAG TPA: hypothetical protein VJJ75_00600 [Candidatus Nanoarchaeia archaeon]|nr:hypothetical protein [Candidatus Nanoarchaeia archaeon]
MLFFLGCAPEKPINYHLDSLYLYFNGEEQDGIHAVTYLSKNAGNQSGEENTAFYSLVNDNLIELQQQFPGISSIDINEWNINYDGAKLQIFFSKEFSDSKKQKILDDVKQRVEKFWYIKEVRYAYL